MNGIAAESWCSSASLLTSSSDFHDHGGYRSRCWGGEGAWATQATELSQTRQHRHTHTHTRAHTGWGRVEEERRGKRQSQARTGDLSTKRKRGEGGRGEEQTLKTRRGGRDCPSFIVKQTSPAWRDGCVCVCRVSHRRGGGEGGRWKTGRFLRTTKRNDARKFVCGSLVTVEDRGGGKREQQYLLPLRFLT